MGSRELFDQTVYYNPLKSPAVKSDKAMNKASQKKMYCKKGVSREKAEKVAEPSAADMESPSPSLAAKKEKKKKEKKKPRIKTTSQEPSRPMEEEKTDNKPEDDFTVFERSLREFDFYHGFLPREDLQTTLQNPGDYLLRVSEIHENEGKVKRELILSLIPVDDKDEEDKKKNRNVIIKRASSNIFFCETSRTFETISELISYYKKNTGTCSSATFQLKNPILIQSWEFMHSDVTIGNVLGEGAFGKVCSGSLKLKDGTTTDVAIKMTKVSAFLSKMKIKEMMNEARFIRNFNHKNVVHLYGVAHREQPLYILLELVKGGSLQEFLKESKAKGHNISGSERIRFCVGAARGIEYLHSNNCIHRDIAARNCLLSDKDKNGEVKITDFGLSRNGPSYRIKSACKLPVKWLAPETITTFTFSFATDVYSWGITCYEIFADGLEPFDTMTNAQFKTDVVAGKYLQMPASTPEPVNKYISGMIFVEQSRRAKMGEAASEFEKFASLSDSGRLEAQAGGHKYKILKGWRPKFK